MCQKNRYFFCSFVCGEIFFSSISHSEMVFFPLFKKRKNRFFLLFWGRMKPTYLLFHDFFFNFFVVVLQYKSVFSSSNTFWPKRERRLCPFFKKRSVLFMCFFKEYKLIMPEMSILMEKNNAMFTLFFSKIILKSFHQCFLIIYLCIWANWEVSTNLLIQ